MLVNDVAVDVKRNHPLRIADREAGNGRKDWPVKM